MWVRELQIISKSQLLETCLLVEEFQVLVLNNVVRVVLMLSVLFLGQQLQGGGLNS